MDVGGRGNSGSYKTECEMKHFKDGYKHVVKSLVRSKESLSRTMNKREKS